MTLYAADCPALADASRTASLLGVSRAHVARLVVRDPAFARCRFARPGCRVMFSTEALRAWIAGPKPRKASRVEALLEEAKS